MPAFRAAENRPRATADSPPADPRPGSTPPAQNVSLPHTQDRQDRQDRPEQPQNRDPGPEAAEYLAAARLVRDTCFPGRPLVARYDADQLPPLPCVARLNKAAAALQALRAKRLAGPRLGAETAARLSRGEAASHDDVLRLLTLAAAGSGSAPATPTAIAMLAEGPPQLAAAAAEALVGASVSLEAHPRAEAALLAMARMTPAHLEAWASAGPAPQPWTSLVVENAVGWEAARPERLAAVSALAQDPRAAERALCALNYGWPDAPALAVELLVAVAASPQPVGSRGLRVPAAVAALLLRAPPQMRAACARGLMALSRVASLEGAVADDAVRALVAELPAVRDLPQRAVVWTAAANVFRHALADGVASDATCERLARAVLAGLRQVGASLAPESLYEAMLCAGRRLHRYAWRHVRSFLMPAADSEPAAALLRPLLSLVDVLVTARPETRAPLLEALVECRAGLLPALAVTPVARRLADCVGRWSALGGRHVERVLHMLLDTHGGDAPPPTATGGDGLHLARARLCLVDVALSWAPPPGSALWPTVVRVALQQCQRLGAESALAFVAERASDDLPLSGLHAVLADDRLRALRSATGASDKLAALLCRPVARMLDVGVVGALLAALLRQTKLSNVDACAAFARAALMAAGLDSRLVQHGPAAVHVILRGVGRGHALRLCSGAGLAGFERWVAAVSVLSNNVLTGWVSTPERVAMALGVTTALERHSGVAPETLEGALALLFAGDSSGGGPLVAQARRRALSASPTWKMPPLPPSSPSAPVPPAPWSITSERWAPPAKRAKLVTALGLQRAPGDGVPLLW